MSNQWSENGCFTTCSCFIIPLDVLEKLSKDPDLTEEIRKNYEHTARVSAEIRRLRIQASALTGTVKELGIVPGALAPSPMVTVYDCKHHLTLPGLSVPNPGSSTDLTAVRTFKETGAVADFFKSVFNRNSIDNAGMTMMSSIHYGTKYNNAMWNGNQMVYGDGDAQIFEDFTKGNDVIGHELTHGVTQHTIQLVYSSDAGGLNESISDCFGSMFRQWQAQQNVNSADWLIGRDIMGPIALQKGFTCLRDMADPAAKHCLSPQPTNYSQITPGMDPHYTSGPPNLAFYLACKNAESKVNGHSWDRVGKIWYNAITGFPPSPNMKMKEFADRTRQVASKLYSSNISVVDAVNQAWQHVGL